MPSDELIHIGEKIVELAAAWPDTGLDKVGELAQALGEALRAAKPDGG
ncbi:MAG: hypothetical protein ABIQ18_23765 [Umezawaea sp.]